MWTIEHKVLISNKDNSSALKTLEVSPGGKLVQLKMESLPSFIALYVELWNGSQFTSLWQEFGAHLPVELGLGQKTATEGSFNELRAYAHKVTDIILGFSEDIPSVPVSTQPSTPNKNSPFG